MALGLLLLAAPGAGAQTTAPTRHVDVIEVNGLVDPVMADFVTDAVTGAEDSGALALVIQVDSGDGVLEGRSRVELERRLSQAEVPVVVWVGPSGARIGGQALALADGADLLAVSPKSRVDLGDRTVPVAAERIDAPTLVNLIIDLDGRTLDGRKLSTAKVSRNEQGEQEREPIVAVRFTKPGLVARLLHTVASPSVAYLLLLIGLLLVVFEFFTAGVGVAAAVGAGCLVLSGYGLDVLPTRPWAAAFLVLGIGGFAIDVQAGAPRFWTVVGTIAIAVGTARLFDGFSPSILAMIAGVGGTALFMVAGMPAMIRTRFSTPTIGREGMIGEEGIAVTAVDPEGTVEVRGAPWRARTNRATPIAEGEPLRVAAIDGLLLEVEPLEGAAKDAGH